MFAWHVRQSQVAEVSTSRPLARERTNSSTSRDEYFGKTGLAGAIYIRTLLVSEAHKRNTLAQSIVVEDGRGHY